jgi:hypothetical protein
MVTVFEQFGINPEEAAACLLDSALGSGMDAADAMRFAAEGTDALAAQEYQPFDLYRLDGGSE